MNTNPTFAQLLDAHELWHRTGSFMEYSDLENAFYRAQLGEAYSEFYAKVSSHVSLPVGWIPAYLSFVRAIQDFRKSHALAQFYLKQVKTKFGQMTIYYDLSGVTAAHRAELERIVSECLKICHGTCMECGAPGEVDPEYSVQIHCPKHMKKTEIAS